MTEEASDCLLRFGWLDIELWVHQVFWLDLIDGLGWVDHWQCLRDLLHPLRFQCHELGEWVFFVQS